MLPDGVRPKYGIFTTDIDFADEEIDSYVRSHNCKCAKRVKSAYDSYAIMEDGTKYQWIKPNDSARGYKCSVGVIDLATCEIQFIREWIMPICIFAEKENFVFVDSQYTGNEAYDLHTLIDRLQKVEVVLGNIPNLKFYEECGNANIRSLDISCDEISFDGF
jgi:hypothetical protein